MQRLSTTQRRARARGFTLVELMIVVSVIAILSALAVYGVRRYITQSKTAEAVQMLGAIRAAQEAYKADTFAYRPTVADPPLGKTLPGADNSYPGFYPREEPLRKMKMSWGAGTDGPAKAWRELGVSTASPVLYIYGCAAGSGADAPAGLGKLAGTIANYPTAADGKPWYLCKAVGDLDNDNDNGEYAYSSLTDDVAHVDPVTRASPE